jgi:hypothetical protein
MEALLVHSLVYTCFAKRQISEVEINDILEVSRRNNEKKGITGMLFFKKNQFLQLLEGDEQTIHDLMNTIATDPRQTGLAILAEGKHQRLFCGWAMHYRRFDQSMQGSSTGADAVALPAEFDKAPLRVRKLLISFANQ